MSAILPETTEVTETKVMRQVLQYHGGKWRISPWIISHFPEHRIYVEPYGGAAGVLLRKPRTYNEIYNDLDHDVVCLFRLLRDREQAAQLCRRLELTPFSRVEFTAAYDIADDPIEKAARLVVRSFMGFGSSGNRDYITGFRAASKQSGRPHAMDWANVPEALHAVTERLKGVVIECRDGLEVISQQDSAETLFFVDPPYLHSTRMSTDKRQYHFEMTANDHRDLARVLRAVKGKVVLSGYQSDLYQELYAGWKTDSIETRGSGNVGSVPRTEVLWMNF